MRSVQVLMWPTLKTALTSIFRFIAQCLGQMQLSPKTKLCLGIGGIGFDEPHHGIKFI